MDRMARRETCEVRGLQQKLESGSILAGVR